MASEESDSGSISPAPKRQKIRYNSADSSTPPNLKSPNVSSSNYLMNEGQNNFISVQQKEKQLRKVKPTQFLCLYDGGDPDKMSFPVYVKEGKPDATVLECCRIHKCSGDFLPVDEQSFSEEQEERWKCVSACAELMLKGLLAEGQKKNSKWIDKNTPKMRMKEIKMVARRWHIGGEVKTALRPIYRTFIAGFKDGQSRIAVSEMLFLCLKVLLGDESNGYCDCIENIGGWAQGYPGQSDIVKLYHRFENKPSERRKEEAKEKLNVEEARASACRYFIPDVAMCNIDPRDLISQHHFLFADCKSSSESNQDGFYDEIETLSQVWHQMLCGLRNYDTVYGIVCSCFWVKFLKLNVKNGKVYTSYFYQPIHETDVNSDSYPLSFRVDKFLRVLKIMMKIVQENFNVLED